jgi:hypothetical protein
VLSRRVVLGSALAVGGLGVAATVARAAGVLDDALQAVGVRPHTEPDPRDVALLADAAQGQRELLALIGPLERQSDAAGLADLRRVLGEQLAAVSDDSKDPASAYPTVPPTTLPADGDEALTAFAARVDAVARDRAEGALSAGSLAVMKVLASMAAGLDQVAITARGLA